MAQVGWIFLDDFGKRHQVGLYHGDASGHLLLHCDRRIVQIDFSVKESRTYSFFIDDEFCEVSLHKESDHFTYSFKVNKKVDTPRNRLRRADERRNRWYMALFLGAMVVVIGGIFGAVYWHRHAAEAAYRSPATSLFRQLSGGDERQLNQHGAPAAASFYIVQEALKRRVVYSFVTADSVRVTGRFAVPDTGLIILPNGFPLTDRDAFETVYLPADPDVHRLDYFRPTRGTLDAYLERAARADRIAHPGQTERYSVCLAQLTLERKGWLQLADLIFQTSSPAQNARHNRDSYHRLVRDVDFAAALRARCWDQ